MTVYQHRFSGVLPAGDIFSIGWHSNTGLSLSSSHANATNWITTAWAGALLTPGLETIYTAGTVVQKCTSYQLNAAFPYQTLAVAETDLTLAGTSVGDSLPQDTAVVVSMRTATPGRKGRGRIYLMAPDAAGLSATGELTTARQGVINGALALAWSTVNALGEQPTIFSRTAGTTLQVTQFGIGTVYDRQARRVNKVSTVRAFEAMP